MKTIDDYTFYEDGRIFSERRKIFMKPMLSTRGYHRLKIHDRLQPWHRMIALAFVPNPENKPFVNHKDGNKLNNHYTNLEWCTQQENNIHALKTGLRISQKGEDHGLSKFKEWQIKAIRYFYKTGCHTQQSLADIFDTKQTVIGNIVRYKRWAHIQ